MIEVEMHTVTAWTVQQMSTAIYLSLFVCTDLQSDNCSCHVFEEPRSV